MYLNILDKILCPSCGEDLVVKESLITNVKERRTDFCEGFLSCKGVENHTFLVVDGVALLVNDLTSYLSSKKSIISELIQAATTSEVMIFIAEQVSNIDEFESNTWEKPTTTSIYIWSHFDSFQEEPQGRFLEMQKIDPDERVSSNHLREVVRSFLPKDYSEDSVGIDIGSSVGGNTHSLSKVTSVAIGCDYSFRAIRTAREIRDTSGMYEYELPVEEQLTETRLIDVDVPNPKKTEFVVADVRALPFQDNIADTALSVNMIDTIRKPLKLLNETDRILAKGGRLITCDPYQWDSLPEALFEETKSDRARARSEEALRGIISGKLGHELVDEQSHVPWILRFNSRSYHKFLVDCIASKKALGGAK